MAGDEIKLIETAETLYHNEQIDEAVESLVNGLKEYPSNNAMQNLLKQYRNIKYIKIPDDFQQELTENKHQSESELNQETITHELQQETDPKQKYDNDINLIEINIIQMRLNVLIMELEVFKTFYTTKLIDNENDTYTKIDNIKMFVDTLAINTNNFEQLQNELLTTEKLSTEIMKKITKVVQTKTVEKEEVKKPEENIEIPDYRSKLTVRGTEEDVKNCIIKAQAALKNGKYDRAENLLLKADRIIPTKNGRDLLEQVRAAKKVIQNSEINEKTTEAAEMGNKPVIENKLISEVDSINAAKCLTGFDKALIIGDFEKADEMLTKAIQFDPSLDVKERRSLLIDASNNKNIEEKRQAKIEEANKKCKTPGDGLYRAIKAYNAGDFLKVQESLLVAKTLDPALNLEKEISTIRDKIASNSSKEGIDIDETWSERTVSESNIKRAAECIYDAKKAYDASDFKKAEKSLIEANTFDQSLNLKLFLSQCRATIASRSSMEEISSTDEAIISEGAAILHTERNENDRKQKKEKKQDNKKSNTAKKFIYLFSILLIIFIVFVLLNYLCLFIF